MGKHKLYECGICDCMHQVGFEGDCREDDERFANEFDYAERTGIDSDDVEIEYIEGELAETIAQLRKEGE